VSSPCRIRLVLRPNDWMADLTNALEVPLDAALGDLCNTAKKLVVGEGSAIASAVPKLRGRVASPHGRASSRADQPFVSKDFDVMG